MKGESWQGADRLRKGMSTKGRGHWAFLPVVGVVVRENREAYRRHGLLRSDQEWVWNMVNL